MSKLTGKATNSRSSLVFLKHKRYSDGAKASAAAERVDMIVIPHRTGLVKCGG